jgi:hypothetical protein
LGVILVLGSPQPVAALSCAPVAGATPEAVAAGTFAYDDGTGFFDHFDFAVIGTVTAVRTDERAGSPTYGATEIDVAVDGVLGVAAAPDAMTLTAADPGWLAGYRFEPGAAYFIPVQALSPEGKVNWTFACDPVTEVADPEVTAARLEPVAAGAGVGFGTPEGPDGSGGGSSGGDGDGTGAGWFVPAVTVAAVLAAAVTTTTVLRRRTPTVAPR